MDLPGIFKPNVARLEAKRNVEALVRALGHRDAAVQELAAYALGRLGAASAAPVLVEALGTGAPAVRRAAAWALGKAGDGRAVEPLLAAMGAAPGGRPTPESLRLREIALQALEALAGARAVEPLAQALMSEGVRWNEQQQRRMARLAARWASGQEDTRALAHLLKHGNPSVRYEVASALEQGGDEEALAPLVEALRDGDAAVRSRAHWGVLKIGGPAALAAAAPAGLAHPDWHVRQETVTWLAEIEGPEAVAPLAAALQSGWWLQRRQAAEALGRRGDARAVQPLAELARRESSWDAMLAVVDALGRLGPAAVDSLLELFARPDLCTIVAMALGRAGDARAVAPLVTVLREGSGLGSVAARALGAIGDFGAVEPLAALVRDGQVNAAEARGALADIFENALATSGKRSPAFLLAYLDDGDRQHILAGLPAGSAEAQAMGVLMDVLPPDTVRARVAGALGQVGDAGAVAPLVRLGQHAKFDVRWPASRAIRALGAVAVDPLLALLHDPDLRSGAAQALAELAPKSAVPALVGLLTSGDGWLRRQAAGILGRTGDPRAVVPLAGPASDTADPAHEAATAALVAMAGPHDKVTDLLSRVQGEAPEALERVRQVLSAIEAQRPSSVPSYQGGRVMGTPSRDWAPGQVYPGDESGRDGDAGSSADSGSDAGDGSGTSQDGMSW